MTTINRNAMLGKIHMAKKALGLDDGAYRDMLHGLFGVESAKDLTDGQLDDLLKHLASRGWQAKPRLGGGAPASKAGLMHKVSKMLTALGKSAEYGDGIARKMFKIDKVAWCDATQLRKIVAALTYHQRRQA